MASAINPHKPTRSRSTRNPDISLLTAVAGAFDANSYATRDQAAAILDNRPGSSAWASATDANKDASLIEATAELEQRFTWRGEASTTTQALAFPQIGLTRDGVEVDSTTIPAELVRATALYADFLLRGGATPGGVLSVGRSIRGLRVQAQDALPGHVLVALPAAWVSSATGSTVGSVSL